jgi:hypothetical protein
LNTEIIRSRPMKPPGEVSIQQSGPVSVFALLRRIHSSLRPVKIRSASTYFALVA